MSEIKTPNLDALRSLFMATPAEEVGPPVIPPDKLVAEAAALAQTASEDRETLKRLGLDEARIDRLQSGSHALTEAQALVANVRRTTRTPEELEAEREAQEFRADALADLRFATRKDPEAQKVLQRISEGDGVDDLNQDLEDVAVCFEQHVPALQVTGVDAKAKAAQSRNHRTKLSTLVAKRRGSDRTEREIYDQRDRMATLLYDDMTEVRETGSHAFRKNPTRQKLYRSEFLARKRKASKAGSGSQNTPKT